MAAMMAGEAVDEAVLDHPCGAVRALDAVAAGAAERQRREAAAIEEEKALLALFEPVGERSDERGCEPAAAVGRAGPHVDRPGLGHGRSEDDTSELQPLMRHSYVVICFKQK